MVAWVEVLITMVDAPSVPIQGTIRRTGPVEPYLSYGGDIPPVYVDGVDDLLVWRDGPNVRVDTVDGAPLARTDGEHAWRWAFGQDLPLLGSAQELGYHGPGNELLTSRPASRWIGTDFAQPVGAIEEVEFLGRACWSFELAPPAHKPHPMQMVVDQRTGMVLEERNDGFGIAVGFIEFTAGIPIDATTFAWTGDIHTPEPWEVPDVRSPAAPSHAERKRRQLNWFRSHVTELDLAVSVRVDLDLVNLDAHDDNGAFIARLGWGPVSGLLARRRRSSLPWEEEWQDDAQTWSTPEHDWAVDLYGLVLDDAALADLQQRLHPGVHVTGVPQIDP
ncbi:hypothetical protein [Williamsia phyllosphaerae]|uniref:Uncharacterized protein n=1 Tax=Williamsia phyllosphaerae TaxID=885042 RepID=A0ABQ1UAY0_9NOCA|nr:hypothetical protein [Williamsia phyllosphaerae]GGF12138.1 hypothetical protein GCM10007298_05130 [Williamsia phyllosphaerae]